MSVKTARRVSPAGRLLQMDDQFAEILRLRAGMSTVKLMLQTSYCVPWHSPCGASPASCRRRPAGRRARLFIGRERTRLAFEHHRDAITDGEGQAVGRAHQFVELQLRIAVGLQRPLAGRAYFNP